MSYLARYLSQPPAPVWPGAAPSTDPAGLVHNSFPLRFTMYTPVLSDAMYIVPGDGELVSRECRNESFCARIDTAITRNTAALRTARMIAVFPAAGETALVLHNLSFRQLC